jgi:hypothetical protein
MWLDKMKLNSFDDETLGKWKYYHQPKTLQAQPFWGQDFLQEKGIACQMQCACCLVVDDSIVAVEWYTFTYTHMVVNVDLIMDMDQICQCGSYYGHGPDLSMWILLWTWTRFGDQNTISQIIVYMCVCVCLHLHLPNVYNMTV